MQKEVLMSKNNDPNAFVYVPLILTIVIDALGVGLVFPVFATLFGPTGGLLPPETSATVTNLLYGITLAAFPIGMFLGAPILGDLSDHLGRKKVLLICLYAECICMWLCAVALFLNSISFIIIFRLLTGLFAGSVGIAQAAVIDISPPHKKAINLSLISIALGVGFAVGPVAGSYFAVNSFFAKFGYSGPFIFAGTLAFLNGTLLLTTFNETTKALKAGKIVWYKGFVLFISGFSSRRLKNLAIALLFIQMAWVLYFQTTSLFMVEVHNYDISQLGYFISYISLVYSIVLIVVIRVLGKFFSIEKIFLYSSILLGCGLLIASFKAEFAAWLAVIPTAAGSGLAYLSVITLFSNSVNKKSQGWVMGIVGSVVAAAACFGSITAGIFVSISFYTTFIIGAIFPFIAVLIIKYRIIPIIKKADK